MIGEVNLFGVFVPALLLLGIGALLLTGLVSRLLALLSVYRLFAYRPLVDIAIFVFLLGGLVFLTASPDMTL